MKIQTWMKNTCVHPKVYEFIHNRVILSLDFSVAIEQFHPLENRSICQQIFLQKIGIAQKIHINGNVEG